MLRDSLTFLSKENSPWNGNPACKLILVSTAWIIMLVTEKYGNSRCYEDEPDYTMLSTILKGLDNAYFDLLISEDSFDTCLEFHHGSWENPESPIIGNRLSAMDGGIMVCCLH